MYTLPRRYEADDHHIDQPSHYIEGRKYEPRRVILDWELNWNLGNALKYISRCGKKGDPIDDLMKAKQYIEFEINDRMEEGSDGEEADQDQ